MARVGGDLKDPLAPNPLPGARTESKQGEIRERQEAGMRCAVEGIQVGKATVINHT